MPAGRYELATSADTFLKVSSWSHTALGLMRREQSGPKSGTRDVMTFRERDGQFYLEALTLPEKGAEFQCTPVARKQKREHAEEKVQTVEHLVDVPMEVVGQ